MSSDERTHTHNSIYIQVDIEAMIEINAICRKRTAIF
jgi:hypothetical protein